MASTSLKVLWNPSDYAANSAAQLTWARELIVKLKLRGDERILDVGCGDGKITAELARALPNGMIVGLDGSMEMLRFASEHFPPEKFSNLEFIQMDARQIHLAAAFDIVFSNATLHWVDDHPAFLRGATACLKPSGRLIISCGGQGNAQDVFIALRATLRTKRWRNYFRKLQPPYFFHRPEDYEKWLPRFGFKPTLVRLANKEVQFDGRDGLAAWIRTTWLPYTQRVPTAQREGFITDVVERFVTKHPLDPGGKLTVRMARLEIDAVKTFATVSKE